MDQAQLAKLKDELEAEYRAKTITLQQNFQQKEHQLQHVLDVMESRNSDLQIKDERYVEVIELLKSASALRDEDTEKLGAIIGAKLTDFFQIQEGRDALQASCPTPSNNNLIMTRVHKAEVDTLKCHVQLCTDELREKNSKNEALQQEVEKLKVKLEDASAVKERALKQQVNELRSQFKEVVHAWKDEIRTEMVESAKKYETITKSFSNQQQRHTENLEKRLNTQTTLLYRVINEIRDHSSQKEATVKALVPGGEMTLARAGTVSNQITIAVMERLRSRLSHLRGLSEAHGNQIYNNKITFRKRRWISSENKRMEANIRQLECDLDRAIGMTPPRYPANTTVRQDLNETCCRDFDLKNFELEIDGLVEEFQQQDYTKAELEFSDDEEDGLDYSNLFQTQAGWGWALLREFGRGPSSSPGSEGLLALDDELA